MDSDKDSEFYIIYCCTDCHAQFNTKEKLGAHKAKCCTNSDAEKLESAQVYQNDADHRELDDCFDDSKVLFSENQNENSRSSEQEDCGLVISDVCSIAERPDLNENSLEISDRISQKDDIEAESITNGTPTPVNLQQPVLNSTVPVAGAAPVVRFVLVPQGQGIPPVQLSPAPVQLSTASHPRPLSHSLVFINKSGTKPSQQVIQAPILVGNSSPTPLLTASSAAGQTITPTGNVSGQTGQNITTQNPVNIFSLPLVRSNTKAKGQIVQVVTSGLCSKTTTTNSTVTSSLKTESKTLSVVTSSKNATSPLQVNLVNTLTGASITNSKQVQSKMAVNSQDNGNLSKNQVFFLPSSAVQSTENAAANAKVMFSSTNMASVENKSESVVTTGISLAGGSKQNPSKPVPVLIVKKDPSAPNVGVPLTLSGSSKLATAGGSLINILTSPPQNVQDNSKPVLVPVTFSGPLSVVRIVNNPELSSQKSGQHKLVQIQPSPFISKNSTLPALASGKRLSSKIRKPTKDPDFRGTSADLKRGKDKNPVRRSQRIQSKPKRNYSEMDDETLDTGENSDENVVADSKRILEGFRKARLLTIKTDNTPEPSVQPFGSQTVPVNSGPSPVSIEAVTYLDTPTSTCIQQKESSRKTEVIRVTKVSADDDSDDYFDMSVETVEENNQTDGIYSDEDDESLDDATECQGFSVIDGLPAESEQEKSEPIFCRLSTVKEEDELLAKAAVEATFEQDSDAKHKICIVKKKLNFIVNENMSSVANGNEHFYLKDTGVEEEKADDIVKDKTLSEPEPLENCNSEVFIKEQSLVFNSSERNCLSDEFSQDSHNSKPGEEMRDSELFEIARYASTIELVNSRELQVEDPDYSPINSLTSEDGSSNDSDYAPSRPSRLRRKKRKKSADQEKTKQARTRKKFNLADHTDKYEIVNSNTELNASSYICKLCNEKYKCSNSRAMVCHLGLHLNGNLNCSKCDFIAHSRSKLREHLAKHTGEALFVCSICGKGFCDKSHYRRHMTSIHKEAKHKCAKCEESFRRVARLKIHIRKKHNSEGLYACSNCSKSFFWKSYYERHVEKDCVALSPCICEECGHMLASRSQLREHTKRVHLKERRFKCELCSFSAFRQHQLRDHKRTHTGDHPYRCEFCDFSGVKRYQLQSHMRTHTGEKPFKCPECNYAAAWNVQLKSHQSAHFSPTKTSCEQCLIVFRDGRSLSIHRKKEHTSP